MELTHWKGGGIAGPMYSQRLGPLDVGELPKPQAGRVNELVTESGFFNLPSRLPDTGTINDALQYRMKIAEDGQTNQVDWTDNSSTPKELDELVQLLAEVDPWQDVPWDEWHEAAPS